MTSAKGTTSGSYVMDAASINMHPIHCYARVPEPALLSPAEANATFSRLPGGAQLIGVCGG